MYLFFFIICIGVIIGVACVTIEKELFLHPNKIFFKYFTDCTMKLINDIYDGDDSFIDNRYYNDVINDIRTMSLVKGKEYNYYNTFYDTYISTNCVKVHGKYWVPEDSFQLSKMFCYLIKEMPLSFNKPYIVQERKHKKMMKKISAHDVINATKKISITFNRGIKLYLHYIDSDKYISGEQKSRILHISCKDESIFNVFIPHDHILDDPLTGLILFICNGCDIPFKYTEENYEKLLNNINIIFKEADWYLWHYGTRSALGSISTNKLMYDVKSLYLTICDRIVMDYKCDSSQDTYQTID